MESEVKDFWDEIPTTYDSIYELNRASILDETRYLSIIVPSASRAQ